MSARRLFLVRHGETDWNLAGRLQGRRDVPLNALGRQQAAEVGRVLQQLAGDVRALSYVASPMGRAVETMRILRTTLDLPVAEFKTDIRFAEISFGRWEGQTWPELRRRDFDAVKKRDLAPWTFAPPGGESYEAVATRAFAALEEIEGNAVIVSHGGVMRGLLHRLTGMPVDDATALVVRQGAVYVVADGRFQIAD